jgi:predicted GIY-YIG superfamily endonuclease
VDDGIVVSMPWAYILRCSDGSLYVGHTDDLVARVVRHNSGFASRYTAQRRPVILAYAEELSTNAIAVARERQLKRWTRGKKEALIARDLAALKRMSKSRQPRLG